MLPERECLTIAVTASCPNVSSHIYSKPQPGSDAVERMVSWRFFALMG